MKEQLRPAKTGLLLMATIMNLLTNRSVSAASFGDDLAFLQQHTEVVVLHDPSNTAQVAVAPAWQGRVLTSTAAGAGGASFGWINRELIASGKLQPHINVFGGEDRFWLGPEGGQFSIFFAPGAKFELSDWFTLQRWTRCRTRWCNSRRSTRNSRPPFQ